MAESIRVISTSTIQAQGVGDSTQHIKIDLPPWDLEPLPLEMNQKGLLYHNTQDTPIQIQIQHLRNTLSTTLAFFPPLAGTLIKTEHQQDNTASFHISCNNVGALFVHALADDTRVTDILRPSYVPAIVQSFFPLNGVRNYQGTSQPLLAVQVTELVDGVFIGITINHVVADGESLWHFVNSWSEISRGFNNPSKVPSLQRLFLNGVEPPLRFPFTTEENSNTREPQPKVRIFHFTKERIAQLKAKANAEAETDKISSLQALLTHLWLCVIRHQGVDPLEDVFYFLAIGVRKRMVPSLPDNYLGNALQVGSVKMRAEELLGGGLGKAAWAMNRMVASHDGEKVRSHYESMARKPILLYNCGWMGRKVLATGSSPKFNVYGNDFGWGKPVAVRTGGSNKKEGMVAVFQGAEEGSVDIEVCLPYEVLEALGNDPDF